MVCIGYTDWALVFDEQVRERVGSSNDELSNLKRGQGSLEPDRHLDADGTTEVESILRA